MRAARAPLLLYPNLVRIGSRHCVGNIVVFIGSLFERFLFDVRLLLDHFSHVVCVAGGG